MFSWVYCSIRTKKLHNISFIKNIFLNFFWLKIVSCSTSWRHLPERLLYNDFGYNRYGIIIFSFQVFHIKFNTRVLLKKDECFKSRQDMTNLWKIVDSLPIFEIQLSYQMFRSVCPKPANLCISNWTTQLQGVSY